MSILPDQLGCDAPQAVVENPHHYSRRWPACNSDSVEYPGYWPQLWNDMMRAHCEEIDRDMRRARREAEWWRARRASVLSTLARVRARWSSKVGAA